MKKIYSDLIVNYPSLEPALPSIKKAVNILIDSYENHQKLLLCGNGGSAADCEHISGELLKGFNIKRSLSVEDNTKMGADIGNKLQYGLSAIPLTGFPALTTAFGNDVDHLYHFAQLTWALGQPGDVLWGITTSGNSKNVCLAMETAKKMGLKTIGMTGKNRGAIDELSDVLIKVDTGPEPYKVQELHLPLYHAICNCIEQYFFD